MQDLRSGIRVLRGAPAMSAVAVLSLALGVGANASIFTLLNSLLLRKISVVEPERLVTVSSEFAISRGYQGGAGWNYAMWQKLRPRADLFDGALAWFPRPVALGSGADSDVVNGLFVSGSFFKTLGVPARYGRVLDPADDVRGGGSSGPVVVVSHGFWQRRLGAEPRRIGTSLTLEGSSFTIVGVTPPEFLGLEVGESFDVALPLEAEPLIRSTDSALLQSSSYLLLVMLRLKPSQTLQSATRLARSLEPEIVPAKAPQFVSPFALAPAAEGTSTPSGGAGGLRQRFKQPLLIVMGVVAFVLLIACLNIAHLSMTRAVARGREFAIRVALGASRWDMWRQLLVENLLLAAAGSVVGVIAAAWTARLLVATMSTPVRTIALNVSIDWRVTAFIVAITIVITLIFGTAPARRASHASVVDALKREGPQTSSSTRRFSDGIVITQIAVSLMLVVAAVLLVRTFAALAQRPLGFDSDRVLIVRVDAMRSHLNPDARSRLFEALVETASRLPGVQLAAGSAWTPLTSGGALLGVSVASSSPDTQHGVIGNFVTPGWFSTYGTPILQGRDFNERDVASSLPVVIVNETFVRHFIRNNNPLGVTVRGSDAHAAGLTIVGVTRDAVFRSGRMVPGVASIALRDDIPPMIYLPVAQSAGTRPPAMTAFVVSVRSSGAKPAALAPNVGAAFATLDPNVSLTMRPLADYVDATLAEDRVIAMLSGLFGLVGLLLAGVGVYGITSYAVRLRRVELGIRLALGANPSGIRQFVLLRVATLVAVGAIAGSLASLWIARTLESLLYGLHADDVTTLVGAVTVLALIGTIAGWIPAARAARTDPAVVLRN